MKNIIIRTIPPITTEKGTTYEWCKNLPGKQVSIYFRKKGTKFANHFHKGDDPSKNPERFFLISGQVEIICEINGSKKSFLVNPGEEMLIYPYTKHWAKALKDSIFIEYRETPFDPSHSDTYPLD